ncbi:hypothetical protein ALO79_200364 [Pseudomonas syringae pv. castaneae]|uniref:ATP-dependent DNA helicase DinG n=1 Tax=Pseudomonas syringae pv. castaneae TaxID=264450 RepID=A0A0P9MSA3_PSESX|nr:hypothetical protein ALO79_200364 [Pseudomonas syringae pv. castaneae]
MLRRQGLDAGDTRDHFELEVAAPRLEKGLQDANSAVVQRRIAPYQKSTALPVGQLFVDQPCERRLLRAVQIFDAAGVVRVAALTFRTAGFDKTIRTINDVAHADVAPQVQQGVLGRSLVHEEEHIYPIQGFYCLHRQVIRITRADADD